MQENYLLINGEVYQNEKKTFYNLGGYYDHYINYTSFSSHVINDIQKVFKFIISIHFPVIYFFMSCMEL